MSNEDQAEQGRLYGDLAWLWPLISPPGGYVAEADEIATLLRRHCQREVGRVLDLGCGGGHMDYGLKRHFNIVGVDLSEAMLVLASKLTPEVTYFCGDLRAPPIDEFTSVTPLTTCSARPIFGGRFRPRMTTWLPAGCFSRWPR